MSKKWIPFFHPFYCTDTKTERLKVINNLVSFVLRGVENLYGPPYEPRFSEMFRNSVKASLFDVFSENCKYENAKSSELEGDTADLLIEAIKEAVGYYDTRNICLPQFSDASLNEKISKSINLEPFPSQDEYEPSVRGAYQCAVDNLLLSNSRRIALKVIKELTRKSQYVEHLLSGYDEIHFELDTRSKMFMLNLLLFDGLTKNSGEATKIVAQKMLYNSTTDVNYSIIQFLSKDGIFPGHWSKTVEDSFREDIKKSIFSL